MIEHRGDNGASDTPLDHSPVDKPPADTLADHECLRRIRRPNDASNDEHTFVSNLDLEPRSRRPTAVWGVFILRHQTFVPALLHHGPGIETVGGQATCGEDP